MKVTISIDDRLLDKARSLTGIVETRALVHAALEALVARESARVLGGVGRNGPRSLEDPPFSRY